MFTENEISSDPVRCLHKMLPCMMVPFRTGPELTERRVGNVKVVEVFDMPPEPTKVDDGIEMVDMIFFKVGVSKEAAAIHRDQFVACLRALPLRESRLQDGPSYIHMGEVMEQQTALSMFAVGSVMGLWNVMTPRSVGITDPDVVEKLARGGFVMIDGFRPEDGEIALD